MNVSKLFQKFIKIFSRFISDSIKELVDSFEEYQEKLDPTFCNFLIQVITKIFYEFGIKKTKIDLF